MWETKIVFKTSLVPLFTEQLNFGILKLQIFFLNKGIYESLMQKTYGFRLLVCISLSDDIFIIRCIL